MFSYATSLASPGTSLDKHASHGDAFKTDDSLYAAYGTKDGLASAMKTYNPMAMSSFRAKEKEPTKCHLPPPSNSQLDHVAAALSLKDTSNLRTLVSDCQAGFAKQPKDFFNANLNDRQTQCQLFGACLAVELEKKGDG